MSRMSWLPVVLLFGAGFLAGYLFGRTDATPDDLRSQELSADPVSAGGARAGGTLTADAAPTLETGGDPYGLRAVLARIPAPEVPAGDGTITGRVIDEGGAGVAGVRVRASPALPPALKAPPWQERADEPLAELVARSVAARRWQETAPREVLTGADGGFELTGLADVEHDVRAIHEGYEIRPKDPKLSSAARPGAMLGFTASVQVAVRVDVYLPDGTTPESATVMFSSGNQSRGTGWSAESRTLRMPPGAYTVTARSGEDGDWLAPAQAVSLEAGRPAALTFQLEGVPLVRGTVRYPPGEALAQCVVRLVRLGPGVKPDAALLMGSDDTEWVHRDRRFRFRQVTPGTYLVGVARTWNGSILAMQTVEVGRGPADVELVLPALRREDYVVVTVLGPDGQPIPNAQLTTGFRSANRTSTGGGTYLKQSDGTYWVLHHEAGVDADAEEALWSVQAEAQGLGVLQQTYRRGSAVELTFRFAAPADLVVRVLGLVGSRYEGRVQLRINGEGVDERIRTDVGTRLQIDEKGRATAVGMQPGTYHVTGALEGDHDVPLFDERVEVSAAGGAVDVTMPDLYVVTILGAAGHCWLSEKTGLGSRSGQAGKDGRVMFDDIRAGTYTVQSGGKRKEFTVPASTEVDLR